MNCQAMSRHRGTSNAYYEGEVVKEVNPKRLGSVRFQLYDILEKVKLWRPKVGACRD